MIKYTIFQDGNTMSKFFPAKLVAMFAEPTENVNATSLHPTHVLVQDVDFPTEIQNQLRSQLFSHYTLGHEKTATNGLYDAKFCCYTIETVYDRVFCVETKPSIGYSVSDEKQFNIIHYHDVKTKWPEEFLTNSHKYVSADWPMNSSI